MAVKFKYKKSLYTAQAIKNSGIETQKEFAKEFDRLARYTNARIDRLKAKYPRAEMLKNVDRSPMWKDILDERGIPNMTQASYAMSSNYRFLNKDVSTIKGYEHQLKTSIHSFNKLFNDPDTPERDWYKPFDKENIFDLFDFLEDYRHKYNVQKIPDSDQLIDIFNEATEKQTIRIESLKQDLFNYLDTNEDGTVSKYLDELMNNERPFSANDYREKLFNS